MAVILDDRELVVAHPAPRYEGAMPVQEFMDHIETLRAIAAQYDTPVTNGALWALDSLKSRVLSSRARECELTAKGLAGD